MVAFGCGVGSKPLFSEDRGLLFDDFGAFDTDGSNNLVDTTATKTLLTLQNAE